MATNEQLIRTAIRIILEDVNDVKNPVAKRALGMIKKFVADAEKYTDSVVAGQADNALAKAMNEKVDELKAFTVWLKKNQPRWAEKLEIMCTAAEALTKRSGFWKTPKFLNVSKHTDEIKEAFKTMKQAALAAWRTINSPE